MIKILIFCVFVMATAGTCEECGKAIDEAVSNAQTQVAQIIPTATAVPAASNVYYLATGDSVASGDDLLAGCGTSCSDYNQAYPALVAAIARQDYDQGLSFKNVSCSGATTSNYINDIQCISDAPQNQATQLAYLNDSPTWVTITVGADDLLVWLINNKRCILDQPFADLLQKPRQECDIYAKVIQPFEENLRQILRAATDHSGLVVVTQYYHVFSPNALQLYNWIAGVNGGIDLLDDSISRIAGEFGSNVTVIDLRPVFATHEWGDSDSYIIARQDCGIGDCVLVPGIHPNAAGQQAIAAAIWSELRRNVAR